MSLHNISIKFQNFINQEQWASWGKRKTIHVPKYKSGKLSKTPFNPLTGRPSCSNNPQTWVTFQEALTAFESGWYNGIGLFLWGMLVGIDLDNCVDPKTGMPSAEALAIIALFPHCYIEYSPSGRGLHIWCLGIPKRCGKGLKDHKWIEVYKAPESNRYLTVTGQIYQDGEILEAQEGLNQLHERYFAPPPPVEMAKTSSLTTSHFSLPQLASHHDALDALSYLDPNCHYDDWLKVGMALKEGGYDVSVWDRWSAQSSKYRPGECLNKWNSFNRIGIGMGTLYHLAKQNGYQSSQPTESTESKEDHSLNSTEPKEDHSLNSPMTQTSETQEVTSPKPKSPLPRFLRKTKWGVIHVNHSVVVDSIVKEQDLGELLYDTTILQFRRYQQGRWSPIEESEWSERIYQIIKEGTGSLGFKTSYQEGVKKMLRDKISHRHWNSQSSLIPFQNGVLNHQTQEFLPHHADYYFTYQLATNYSPQAQCPKFVKWLDESTGHPQISQVIRAFFNAVLTGKPVQKYLELIGSAGSGKSTLCNILISCLGASNVRSTTFELLERDKFEIANLIGKRLILLADQQGYTGTVNNFKRVIGRDYLPIRRMRQQGSKEAKSSALAIVTANEPVQSRDYTSGLYRRRITVRFDHVPTHRRDLEKELQGETAGIINWALSLSDEEVTRLLSNTLESVPELRTQSKYNLISTNPLAKWLDEQVVLDQFAKAYIGMAERISPYKYQDEDTKLYANYCKFCEVNGTKPTSNQHFSNLVLDLLRNQLRLGQQVQKKRDSLGVCFEGIRLRASYDDERTPSLLDWAYEGQMVENERLLSESPSSVAVDVEPAVEDNTFVAEPPAEVTASVGQVVENNTLIEEAPLDVDLSVGQVIESAEDVGDVDFILNSENNTSLDPLPKNNNTSLESTSPTWSTSSAEELEQLIGQVKTAQSDEEAINCLENHSTAGKDETLWELVVAYLGNGKNNLNALLVDYLWTKRFQLSGLSALAV